VVGQQINLAVKGLPTDVTPTYQWTIPGAIFKDYQPDANNSHYVDVTDFASSSNSFYWSDGATGSGVNRTITCSTTVNGQSIPLTATLNVQRPDATITAKYGTIGAGLSVLSSSTPFLYFGTDSLDNIGIFFTMKNVTQPPGFSDGYFTWSQSLDMDSINVTTYTTSTNIAGSSTNTYTTNHIAVGGHDGGIPPMYPNSIDPYVVDSPVVGLDPDQLNVTRNFKATMYLMWQPLASSTGDNTVPVAIKSFQWSWSGTATNTNLATYPNGWELLPGSAHYPTNTTDTYVTNEPQWTFAAPQYTPPL